ncbi:uncharacterized protein [Argopecten irradians]|uniref:uncharacterized protein n=1 Tax=Argopecten irradians TaxID=31199 RepID=UPI00371674DF
MVMPTTLKKRHSLKGLSLLPAIRKLQDEEAVTSLKGLARVSVGRQTEDLPFKEVAKQVADLTGEQLGELLSLAGKGETDLPSGRLLLHFLIILANERGQPLGQDLVHEEAGTSTSTRDGQEPTDHVKRRRVESTQSEGTKLERIPKDPKDKGLGNGRDHVSLTHVPEWEQFGDFNPYAVNVRDGPTWVTLKGRSLSPSTLHSSAEDVVNRGMEFDIDGLPLRDPDNFVAGQLHDNIENWETIFSKSSGNDMVDSVRSWIAEGVDVVSFFRHFRGNFRGRPYDSALPPRQFFPNAPICKDHIDFICRTLSEKIASGAIRVLGKIGECELPRVVMPLTIEPSKPRLCHDCRYINLWTKDSPFKLETLRDVHRLVEQGAYMVTCDEKSGYDHVRISVKSQTFFGLHFGGYVMVYTVIPFGWKASPYIYQTTGMVVTSYLRSISVVTTQYIDDRMAVAGKGVGGLQVLYEAEKVAYVLVEVLTRLGYTLALEKCSLVPSTCIRFLGYLIDSVRQAYILPKDKKEKFVVLRELILSSGAVDVKTLQRFAGKCISMGLVVPGSKLFCREVNSAIATGIKNSRKVSIDGNLREEVCYWRFLDNWNGCAKWRPESHKQVSMSTDASLFRYGAVVSLDGESCVVGDYFDNDDARPIHLKEASAVLKALESFAGSLSDSRVDLLTDNMAVLSVWENQGGRDGRLNRITKQIFEFVVERNIDLHMQYIPSCCNAADQPSRKLDFSECTLGNESWELVEKAYGPHTIDLMALDSNVRKSPDGESLRHYTPFPTPESAGVNVYAQNLRDDENKYVFPPFGMIASLLSLFREQSVDNCTCVLPVISPVPVWWPLLQTAVVSSICVGKQFQKGVIKVPTRHGFIDDSKGLKWQLVAFRLSFS